MLTQLGGSLTAASGSWTFYCALGVNGRVACRGNDVANMLAAAVDPQLPELAIPASYPVE